MRRTLIALSLAGSLAAAPATLLDPFWSFLSSVWSETGCHIDPSGKCAPTTDTGLRIDPDGAAQASQAGPETDTGHIMDPDGRT